MKAVVYHEYGSPEVLQLADIEKPTVQDDQVLVRVGAASANPYDWHFMRGEPYFMRLFTGLQRPRSTRLGADFAGRVEAVGSNVTRFRPGDGVFGLHEGTFSEYISVPTGELAHKPANLTFDQAAAVPMAGLTALQGLRDAGRLEAGQRVLIIGASGGVGTFAVQLAKVFDAHVTGVCSTKHVESVHALGADHVIDYTKEDFAHGARKYDLVLQLGGADPPGRCRRALTSTGRLVLSSGDASSLWFGPLGRIAKAALVSPFVSQSSVTLSTKRNPADLEYLAALLDAGEIKPVLDSTYPLSQAAEAIRHLEEGHPGGKVVISV